MKTISAVRRALALVMLLVSVALPIRAFAVDVSSLLATPANTSAEVQSGEIDKGHSQANAAINTMVEAVIASAVTLSTKLKSEADKFAGGLGVITIVLAAVKFAGTRDPVGAWIAVFEELGMLGIFASIYVGYVSAAPWFFNWFARLANEIAPNINGAFGAFGAISGQFFDALIAAFHATPWYDMGRLAVNMGPTLAAYIIMSITSIVISFYTHIGQIQSAVGIVLGQIAFALGFSSFTRGYFKSWLDYMVSAGMYVVVSAILVSLVGTSLATALQTSGLAAATGQGAAVAFDLSLFMLLLAFEIPKMASIFGGGANASGAALGKIAKTATGGLL